MSHQPTETYASRLTAAVPAAIATIAIRGPAALSLIQQRVRMSSPRLEIGHIYYGTWQLPLQLPAAGLGDQPIAAEQVVICRTAAESVEVHCHGGAAVCRALLDDLASAGCTVIAARDWPSNLSCPLACDAEHDLLMATTDRGAAVLLDQLQGALRQAVDQLCEAISRADCQSGLALVERLLDVAPLGLHLAHPWQIVLAGPPNVGKSSLMNALVGTEQAIVHHEPGTTRDWIEAAGAIAGWPVLFTDTAGVRAADDAIEQAGVEHSRSRLERADLAIFVVDARQGWTTAHDELLNIAPAKRLVAWNKADLVPQQQLESLAAAHGPPGGLRVVQTSTLAGPGISGLLEAIAQELGSNHLPPGTAVPFRHSHVQCLTACRDALRQADTTAAAAVVHQWLEVHKATVPNRRS